MRLGRGLRFSSNDRTDEVIKLFIIWLFFFTKKNIFIEAEVDILHPVMRALTNSFTNSIWTRESAHKTFSLA